MICDRQTNYLRLNIAQHDVIIDTNEQQLLNKSNVKRVSHVTITPDGKYIIFLAGDRLLCMRRYSDNKLLAQYTVYDPVCSLAVSTNNHYVLIGTSDRRLLTLVIADPDEREHDERIAYVRAMNPGLNMNQALKLLTQASPTSDSLKPAASDDSSDDDDDVITRGSAGRAHRRKSTAEAIPCFHSDDESGSDADDRNTVTNKSALSKTNASEQVPAKADDLPSTAHGGHIFTSTACSLQ